MKQEEYLCKDWMGYIQQIVNLLTHGYFYYYTTEFPERKRKKWHLSDRKLISLYPITTSKDTRYRRRKAKMANYAYLRWDCHAIILHTGGKLTKSEHNFSDFREVPLEVRLNDESGIKFRISKDAKGFTVYLCKTSYQEIKAAIMESIERHNIDDVIYRFNALNGLPAYSGIIRQRNALLVDIRRTCRKHNTRFNQEDYIVRTKRKSVKVYK